MFVQAILLHYPELGDERSGSRGIASFAYQQSRHRSIDWTLVLVRARAQPHCALSTQWCTEELKTRFNDSPDLFLVPAEREFPPLTDLRLLPWSNGRKVWLAPSAMSDNTNGSNNSLPVIWRADANNECSYVENCQKDHKRLTLLIMLLEKTDDLDLYICDIVHNIVDGEFIPDTHPFDHNDIADIIQTMLQLEDALTPSFLCKVAFPHRMLRISLSLPKMNPVPDHQISDVRMTDTKKRNYGLNQFIWFQFLAGSTAAQVDDNLIAYRQAKSDARAPFWARSATPSDLPMVEDNISPPHSIHDAQVPSRRLEPTDARAYNDDSFRGPIARATESMSVDTKYNQIEKGCAVHYYFKDRQFTGARKQSIDTLLRH